MRSRSSVVVPGSAFPRSRSACRTHSRSVSALQPILAAIDAMVAHSERVLGTVLEHHPHGTLAHLG